MCSVSSRRKTSERRYYDGIAVLRSGKGIYVRPHAHTSAAHKHEALSFCLRFRSTGAVAFRLDSSKPPLGFPSPYKHPETRIRSPLVWRCPFLTRSRPPACRRPSRSPTAEAPREDACAVALLLSPPPRRSARRRPALRAARLAGLRSARWPPRPAPTGTPWTAWGARRWTSSSTSTRAT